MSPNPQRFPGVFLRQRSILHVQCSSISTLQEFFLQNTPVFRRHGNVYNSIFSPLWNLFWGPQTRFFTTSSMPKFMMPPPASVRTLYAHGRFCSLSFFRPLWPFRCFTPAAHSRIKTCSQLLSSPSNLCSLPPLWISIATTSRTVASA